MSAILDRLTPRDLGAFHHHLRGTGGFGYDGPNIRARVPILEPLDSGLLAADEDAGRMDFAVFRLEEGSPDTVENLDAYTVLFWGWGYTGNRELRHTYWGAETRDELRDGHIPYPNAKLICTAFDKLKRWFD